LIFALLLWLRIRYEMMEPTSWMELQFSIVMRRSEEDGSFVREGE